MEDIYDIKDIYRTALEAINDIRVDTPKDAKLKAKLLTQLAKATAKHELAKTSLTTAKSNAKIVEPLGQLMTLVTDMAKNGPNDNLIEGLRRIADTF